MDGRVRRDPHSLVPTLDKSPHVSSREHGLKAAVLAVLQVGHQSRAGGPCSGLCSGHHSPRGFDAAACFPKGMSPTMASRTVPPVPTSQIKPGSWDPVLKPQVLPDLRRAHSTWVTSATSTFQPPNQSFSLN